MTKEEAIICLKGIKDYGRDTFTEQSDWQNSLDIAIKALEQPTSDDCVSRQAVLEMIEQIQDAGGFIGYNTYSEAFDQVDNMPPVTPTQSWIPVSERLPEDRNIVLVTAYWHETYQVMMASYFGDGLWWCVPFNNCGDHMQKLNPKAWQPLPQPYKEKQGENDEMQGL